MDYLLLKRDKELSVFHLRGKMKTGLLVIEYQIERSSGQMFLFTMFECLCAPSVDIIYFLILNILSLKAFTLFGYITLIIKFLIFLAIVHIFCETDQVSYVIGSNWLTI